jgi:hypothetical protein
MLRKPKVTMTSARVDFEFTRFFFVERLALLIGGPLTKAYKNMWPSKVLGGVANAARLQNT